MRKPVSRFLAGLVLVFGPSGWSQAAIREIIVTNDVVLARNSEISARLVIATSHVTIDGNGATLVGPGQPGQISSLENAGTGVLMKGVTGVTLKNLKARGFSTGLVLRDAQATSVEGCDFSDNYNNPAHGWGELPARGGIILERARQCVIRNTRANRVWDGIHLIDADDNLIAENDFSHCANTCAKLWKASRNKFLRNNLSYGIRIDRAKGEVHARDSTGVLIETGSNDNYWFQNDITQGGDGIFIRPLNRWVSRGNIFVENDTSYANNNCVESWSPGNVFIRNKANHGSYGFWLGGSDQTVLIGNEAAFNGLPTGNHNAPEAGFSHGGIVVVGGPGSHTLIQGNNLHHNNGAGIAFRGDTRSRGTNWQTEHWVVQQNRIASNRFGIWGRWGRDILLAGNEFIHNTNGNDVQAVTDLVDLPPSATIRLAPKAVLHGPKIIYAGTPTTFDASASADPESHPLHFVWSINGKGGSESVWQRTFDRPGFYRLGLTVHNGALADLAWRDLLVVPRVAEELGTEGEANRWGFELENNSNGRGRILFTDEPGIIGSRCLGFTPNPYPGAYATAIYPRTRDAGWNLSGKSRLRFWLKALNPNTPGYQNAGPVVRLLGSSGHVDYKPVKDQNLLNDPPFSEARWLWMPIEIPLKGDARWQTQTNGTMNLDKVQALSIAVDSWGGDPFTLWLDGLSLE